MRYNKARELKVPQAPSTAIAVPIPPGGRLLCAVPLRMVGTGFSPILRGGLPHAMLAPDASVGKAGIQPQVELLQ